MRVTDIINNNLSLFDGDLKAYFRLVLKAPNAYMPYHNTRHTLHVLWEAFDGGIKSGLRGKYLRSLLVAALFHDFNHTGTPNESENITRAIKAFKDQNNGEDKYVKELVVTCITHSKYPYESIEHLTPKKQLIVSVLRDSDLSQVLSPVWIQSILYGLGQELNLSYMDMLEKQITFLNNLEFKSEWGKMKFPPLVYNKLSEVNSLIDILR